MYKKVLGMVAVVFGFVLFAVSIVNAASSVIYSSIPDPIPGNVPSLGFEATSTSEFGGQVQFAGTDRYNPTVTVLMSSWACQSGHWTSGDCVTTPGETYSHPITLNIYNVGAGNSVGSLIVSKTQTFDLFYRPSSDIANCDDGKWSDGTTCYNGYAFPISFNLAGTVLPDKVIIGVAYNTSHYGASPLGTGATCYSTPQGCPYDSLNVGTYTTVLTGTALPSVNDAYLDSSWGGAYCDEGSGGTGTFRLDAACWTGYLPAFKVEASTPEALKGKDVRKATGGIWMGSPNQQMQFSAFDQGISMFDKGDVEYWNYEYPGLLHYKTSVKCANVDQGSGNARFMFQIPEGWPGLSGLYVVAMVHDGGTPGTKGDTYGHGATSSLETALNWCDNGFSASNYPIVGGNLVVHK